MTTMAKKYNSAIVFASYREAENLEIILNELNGQLDEGTLVVIADDSGEEFREVLEETCNRAHKGSTAGLEFNYALDKAGRGAAIRRSFVDIHSRFPDVVRFVESDSDGSHRPADIVMVLNSESKADLLIGSRYLPDSQIIGWSLTRRMLSKTLNTFIPRILSVKAKDLTNGLRRYSPAAIEIIETTEAQNSGFIYLSEVAKKISDAGLTIQEIPIQFEERVHGSSTVGFKELTDSLTGLFALIFKRK